MQQYFVNDQLALQHPVMLDDAQTHHVLHVMRMKNETLVRVADNSGIVMLAKIVINGNEVTAVPFEVVTQRESDETEITLIMSLIKGERWDMAIQKACELGVNRIVPLQSRYSVVKLLKEKTDKKLKRWQAIAKEACEQSKRPTIAEITEPITMKQLHLYQSDLNLIAYERSDAASSHLGKALRSKNFRSVSVMVGCEGGFSEEEVEQAQNSGFTCISLGSNILRAETAAIALVANIRYELESREMK